MRIWQGESVEIGVAGTPPECSSTPAKCRDLILEDARFLGRGCREESGSRFLDVEFWV